MEIVSSAALVSFFETLGARLPCRVKIILTGGAQALLMGSDRPTRDLDFEITLVTPPEPSERHWPEIESAIAAASQATQVAVQYSTDIDRWSAIAMPDYRGHTRLYRRFGRLSVHLLAPAYWAVPKLARYLDSDIADLQVVLRTQGVRAEQLARVCGRALRASPRSTALFTFRQHVEHFLRTFGPRVWGSSFDAEAVVHAFWRAAGITFRRS